MFIKKSSTLITRDLNKKVVKMIHSLLDMQQSVFFRKPVPHKALGLEDYRSIVKKPTDLNLIRRKNNQDKFEFVEEILDEIQLCWDNCKVYNSPQSEIYGQAMTMQRAFDTLGSELFPEIWQGIIRQQSKDDKPEKIDQQAERKMQSKLKKSQPQADKKKLLQTRSNKSMLTQKIESQGINNRADIIVNKSKQLIEDASLMQEQLQASLKNLPEHMSAQQQLQDHSEQYQGHCEPIMVNLSKTPSQSQLLQLSKHIKRLLSQGEHIVVQKVLQVLHHNQKQNMSISKNGLMTFQMSKIHLSTYYRMRKVLGLSNEGFMLIQ